MVTGGVGVIFGECILGLGGERWVVLGMRVRVG